MIARTERSIPVVPPSRGGDSLLLAVQMDAIIDTLNDVLGVDDDFEEED